MFINDFDHPAGSDIALSSTEAGIKTNQVVPQLAWTPAASEDEIGGRLVVQSVEHLQSYLAKSRQTSNRIMLFGTVSDTTVGVYVGANLLGSSVAGGLFDSFLNNLYSAGIADSKAALVQVCDGRSGNDIFGLIAASSAEFSTVHDAVGRWSNGSCVDTSPYAETREVNPTAVAFIEPKVLPTPVNGTAGGNSTAAFRGRQRRTADDCRTVTVDDNDDCGKLVTRCSGGLTTDDFYKYNPNPNLCSTLMPGQRVCCTAGELPDIRPKQNADGSCFPYQIQLGEFCNKVATENGLTVENLEDFNKETWGVCYLCFITLLKSLSHLTDAASLQVGMDAMRASGLTTGFVSVRARRLSLRQSPTLSAGLKSLVQQSLAGQHRGTGLSSTRVPLMRAATL